MSKHTLSVLVENKPGVLARIAGLFSRRGYNIDSLAVGPTEAEGLSRMTIVVNVESKSLEQVTKQLNKLINVIKILEHESGSAVERELMLIKIRAVAEVRGKIIELADVFRAKILDVGADAMTVEVTGSPDKLQAFEDLVTGYGIIELVKTGRVALARGSKSIKDRTLRVAG